MQGEYILTNASPPVSQVENFSEFVDDLVADIRREGREGVTHILDFGSGQAYLSRTLAKKYGYNVVGIESRTANIEGAREMDERFDNLAKKRERKKKKGKEKETKEKPAEDEEEAGGSLQYIEKRIEDGDLGDVVRAIRDLKVSPDPQPEPPSPDEAHTNSEYNPLNDIQTPNPTNTPQSSTSHPKHLLLISLHSCGNLVHHGLKAFLTTPEVKAVALIGTPSPSPSHPH